jgi:cellulose biosynthesis protein BcsQ
MTETQQGQGTVITFYSFKGGTGRTMALANVAWILASSGRRVLAADWDLESPGLHRFLHPFLDRADLRTTQGVIGMIHEFENATMDRTPKPEGWHREYARVVPKVVPVNWEFPEGGSLDFLPAGSHNRDYASILLSLSWDNFFDTLQGALFFDALREDMKAKYDYVLIDSRTGLSDVSDICTIHLPDVLVDCFTLSEQGIDGAANRAREITDRYPQRSIRILPVPMRVDEGEKEKADAGRSSARDRFAPLPADLSDTERARYWGDVEIPYRPFYAYEETLAAFGDAPNLANSLLSAFERLTSYITQGQVTRLAPIHEPERLRTLDLFVRKPKEPGGPHVVAYVPADVMWGEWITEVLRRAGFAVNALEITASAPALDRDARIVTVMSRSFAATEAAVDYARAAAPGGSEPGNRGYVSIQVRGAPSEQPLSEPRTWILT